MKRKGALASSTRTHSRHDARKARRAKYGVLRHVTALLVGRPLSLWEECLDRASGKAPTRRRTPNLFGAHPHQPKPRGHRVQKVDVVLGGVAGVAAQVKAAGINYAQLLHPDRCAG